MKTLMIPRGHWKDKKHHQIFFNELAVKWKIQTPQDWFKVKIKKVLEEGGGFVNNYYQGSLIKGNFSLT
jgi:hypothetical protein